MINAHTHQPQSENQVPPGVDPVVPVMPTEPAQPTTLTPPPPAVSSPMPSSTTAPPQTLDPVLVTTSSSSESDLPMSQPLASVSPSTPPETVPSSAQTSPILTSTSAALSGAESTAQNTDAQNTHPVVGGGMGAPPIMPPSKKKPSLKVIAGAVLSLLVIIGGFAAYILQERSQDIRQQAASEEVTDTEKYRTPQDWQNFHQRWLDFLATEPEDWREFVAFAKTDGARYSCSEPIMTVGKETLYGCDLNALFAITNNASYIRPGAISPQDSELNEVLDRLITNSGILQEAEKQGEIVLDASFFNSPEKDTAKRYEILSRMREVFADKFEKTVDFEVITIYFHNQEAPLIPLEQAKAAAQTKMDILYQRLQSGEITMKEAGDEIKADNILGDTTGISLSQMDPLYVGNAYISHTGHKFNSVFFKDPVYDEELRSLGEGQMSTVRLCRDYAFTTDDFIASVTGENTKQEYEFVESCYLIFKVNAIHFGLSENIGEGGVEGYIQDSYKKEATVRLE